jgi:hypothetical protein
MTFPHPLPSYITKEPTMATVEQSRTNAEATRLTEDIVDAFSARPVPGYEDARRAAERLLSENVIVARGDLPAIEISPSGNALALLPALGKFQMLPVPGCSTEEAVERTRQVGLAYLAYARYLSSEDVRVTNELRQRRDDIAFELLHERSRYPDEARNRYDDLIPVVRRAVDRIIEAEDAR